MIKLDLKDWENRNYTTRDGREVRLAAIDGPGGHPIIGWFREVDGGWSPAVGWSLEGARYYLRSQGDDDLFNAPEESVFVPGWFWIDRVPGFIATADEYSERAKDGRALIRIPPPSVIGALRVMRGQTRQPGIISVDNVEDATKLVDEFFGVDEKDPEREFFDLLASKCRVCGLELYRDGEAGKFKVLLAAAPHKWIDLKVGVDILFRIDRGERGDIVADCEHLAKRALESILQGHSAARAG